MNITIERKLKESVPGLVLGCVRANVQVEKHNAALWSEIDAHINSLSSTLTAGTLTELPNIKAVRDAYKSIGKDPSRYRGAAEGKGSIA